MSPFTLFMFQVVLPVTAFVCFVVCTWAILALVRDQRRMAGLDAARDAADEPAEPPVGARSGGP